LSTSTAQNEVRLESAVPKGHNAECVIPVWLRDQDHPRPTIAYLNIKLVSGERLKNAKTAPFEVQNLPPIVANN